MIPTKSPSEVERIAESARIVGGALRLAKSKIAEGLRTIDLDAEIEAYIRDQGAVPSFKGYRGFPASACISVNDEVVHGIPSDRVLKAGDIVSVDVGAYKDNMHGDGAWTFPVGNVSEEATTLMRVTIEALEHGIGQIRPGGRLGEYSHAVQRYVEERGYSVVRMLVGHGIGRKLHEEPQVPNFGGPTDGPLLKAGMVLALEPMVNAGGFDVITQKDGWTVVTRDRSLSAHFEHTVAITEQGPRILTTPGPGSPDVAPQS